MLTDNHILLPVIKYSATVPFANLLKLDLSDSQVCRFIFFFYFMSTFRTKIYFYTVIIWSLLFSSVALLPR